MRSLSHRDTHLHTFMCEKPHAQHTLLAPAHPPLPYHTDTGINTLSHCLLCHTSDTSAVSGKKKLTQLLEAPTPPHPSLPLTREFPSLAPALEGH